MVRRRRQAGGFTLVELLIALAISTIGLLGLTKLQMIAIRSNSASRNFAEAVSLAQETLESLQVAPIANLVSGADSPTPGIASQNMYTRTWTITSNGTQATIRVVLSWPDAYLTGVTHTVTMYDLRSL